MGLDDARKSVKKLDSKYIKSFANYAAEGFIKTLARCIDKLDKETADRILESYPEELRLRVLNCHDLYEEKDIASNEKERNFILFNQNLTTLEDYVELNDAIMELSYEEYKQLLNEYEDNQWMSEKLKVLCPKYLYMNRLDSYEIQEIIQVLSWEELRSLFTYAPESFKTFLKSQLSKNNVIDLEKEALYSAKVEPGIYKKAVRKINSLIRDERLNGNY